MFVLGDFNFDYNNPGLNQVSKIYLEKEKKYYDIILKRVGDFNKNFETQTLFGNEM